MSENPSSRFVSRSSRGHVRRRRQQSFPSWFIVVIGILGLIAIVALVREIVSRLSDEEGVSNTQSNRAWLGEEWTLNAPNSSQIETLVERLKQNRIKAVYVVTGAWRADNQYRAYEFAPLFYEEMKKTAPEIDILAWIWYEPSLHANDTSETSLVDYARTAIEDWNYEGVHLQGFSVPNRSERYVRLVRALEVVLGDEHILSITVPPDHIPTDPNVPRGLGNPAFSWEPTYKQQLALIADEMVIMPHASFLKSPEDYELWVAYQVETYAQDVRLMDVETALVIGFPAYPEDVGHDPSIEDVANAVAGTRRGLSEAGEARRYIVGAGIYLYSTASENDWVQFYDLWVK